MIGQTKILDYVDNHINDFPHFIVLIGSCGSGKKTLAQTIAHKLSMVYSQCEINVSAVREVIDISYQSTTKVMYCFADADNMRPEAKNAMLKITEEPPKDAYFCLTVCDSNSLLDTITSRAYVFNMEEYSKKELELYLGKNTERTIDNSEKELILSLAQVPQDIDLLVKYGTDFVDFVNLVIDNIAEIVPENAFKSCGKIGIKNDDGYSLELFWRTFIHLCMDKCKQTDLKKYLDAIIVTSKYVRQVNKLGVNKQQLYDMWIFEIRQVL